MPGSDLKSLHRSEKYCIDHTKRLRCLVVLLSRAEIDMALNILAIDSFPIDIMYRSPSLSTQKFPSPSRRVLAGFPCKETPRLEGQLPSLAFPVSQTQPIRANPVRTPLPLHHLQLKIPLLPRRCPATNKPFLPRRNPPLPKAAGIRTAVAASPSAPRFLHRGIEWSGRLIGRPVHR